MQELAFHALQVSCECFLGDVDLVHPVTCPLSNITYVVLTRGCSSTRVRLTRAVLNQGKRFIAVMALDSGGERENSFI